MSTQRWPREWLMTDERMGDRLWSAIARLPRNGGVVFRHYSLGSAERSALGRQVAQAAAERKALLAVARDEQLALRLGARLVHNPDQPGTLPFSRAVHTEAEALRARQDGTALVFVSPVFPTRSHVGASALGKAEALRFARLAGCPAVALGGMNRQRISELGPGFHGYAGIDCWLS